MCIRDRYRNKNKPTNVLSFPSIIQKNNENFLGDIIFSAETIFSEAKREKKSFKSHLIHLFIHGVLHLLGFDHAEQSSAEQMEALEVRVLKKLKEKEEEMPKDEPKKDNEKKEAENKDKQIAALKDQISISNYP